MNSVTYDRIMELIAKKEVLVSTHGYDELAEDYIRVQEVLDSIDSARVLEDYPDYPKGPAVLLLQQDWQGDAIHTSLGYPRRRCDTGNTHHRLSPRSGKMVTRFYKEALMHTHTHTKYIVEGKYLAEVKVTFHEDAKGWSPYLSLDDALKLDTIREALKKNDLKTAQKSAVIYTLSPVAA